MHTFTEFCWVSWFRRHPFPPSVFFAMSQNVKNPTFSNSSQAISPICMKLGTQHLWTLLTKCYQKSFNRTINFKADLVQNRKSCIFPHWSGLMKWNSGYYYPWAPEALCKILGDDNKVALFKLMCFISPQWFIGLTRNLVYLLSVPSWGHLMKGLPIRH